jgi:hypothetical protein
MAGALAVKNADGWRGQFDLRQVRCWRLMQGAKLRMVMRVLRQLPYDLVAAPEIKRVEDLRGKKIAVADCGSGDVYGCPGDPSCPWI